MDIFKYILDETCKDSPYKYERVESLAEIYLGNDVIPIAIVEYKRSYGTYEIRFRMGLSAIDVGKLVCKMTLAESALTFEDDFFIDPEFGYLYGDEARQAFVNKLKANIEASKASQQDAFFMSEIPLNVFGNDERTKYQKMWDDE
jgi:hypothetical protein